MSGTCWSAGPGSLAEALTQEDAPELDMTEAEKLL